MSVRDAGRRVILEEIRIKSTRETSGGKLTLN